jgi:thiol-disulfide isomerase/thioredoxin
MHMNHETDTRTDDAPRTGMSRGQAAAWVAALAVGAALVLTLLSPSGETPEAGAPNADAATVEAPMAAAAAGTDAAVEPAAGPTVDEVYGDTMAMLDAGMPAPLDYTLADMDGVDVSLASFRGKVVLLNFWATWCGPCKAEIPDLIELQAKYPDELVVLGISVDDTPEQMRPYAEAYGINYPVLVGNGRDDFKDAYGPLWGIPVSVIVDREGTVHVRHNGLGTFEEFEQEVLQLL